MVDFSSLKPTMYSDPYIPYPGVAFTGAVRRRNPRLRRQIGCLTAVPPSYIFTYIVLGPVIDAIFFLIGRAVVVY